jgi:hypothetical protein
MAAVTLPTRPPGTDTRLQRLSDEVAAAATVAASAALARELAVDGVAVMVLKGPPVQRRLLGTDTAYRSADVDLLVPRAAAGRARRRLLTGGWRFSEHNGVLWRLDRAAAYTRGGVTVDLHWGLHAGFVSASMLRSLEAALWQGARRGAEGWYEPEAAPLAVYLAVHAAANGWRPEVLRMLARAAEEADVDRVRAVAEKAGIWPAVDDALARARGQRQDMAPPAVVSGTRALWVGLQRTFRHQVAPAWLQRIVARVRAEGMTSAAGEAVLTVRALPLARGAQRVAHGVPLPDVMARLCRRPPKAALAPPTWAAPAADRACRLLAATGHGRDTCLVRSLVLAALLADRPGVVLHVALGRVPGPEPIPSLEGHAWVTIDGRPATAGPDAVADRLGQAPDLAFPVGRQSGVRHGS